MQAYKTTAKPDAQKRVTIELPEEFTDEPVEVIILASPKTTPSVPEPAPGELTEEQKLLLAFPVATEDIEFIEEKRRHLNSWK
jgi:hypothetical protein